MMGMRQKKTLLSVLVAALILLVILILAAASIIKPLRYDRNLDAGLKHIEDAEFDSAINSLDKAQSINENDYRAYLALAEAYAAIGDNESALENARQVREIVPDNEDVLIDILEIIEPIDPLAAYFMLKDYSENFNAGRPSNEIKSKLEDMTALPDLPMINYAGGSFIKPVTVYINSGAMKYGHAIYYTLDGNIPTRRAQKYDEQIIISESMLLQYISYNPLGYFSDTAILYFEINYRLHNRLVYLVEEADEYYESTSIVSEREALRPLLEEANGVLEKDNATVDEAEAIYDRLNEMLGMFKQ